MADLLLLQIGERFLVAREQLGLNIRDAGLAARVSNGFICQVEQGKSRISLDRAARLAAVYGVSLDWLATGRATPSPETPPGNRGEG